MRTAVRNLSQFDRAVGKPESGIRVSFVLAEMLLLWAVLVAVYLVVGVTQIGFNKSSLLQLAWINNIALVVQLALLRKSFGSLTAPFVMYALFLSLFTSGQLILFSIGIEPAGADVFNREAPRSIGRAIAFYLTGFSAFCAAGVIANEFMRGRRPLKTKSTIASSDWQTSVKSVGTLCIVLGVVPFVILNVHNLRVVLALGYSGYYAQGVRLQSPLLSLAYLFITGLVLWGCCGHQRLRNIATITLILVAGVRLVSGDRGQGMIYLLTAFLLMTVFAKIPRRRLVWAAALAGFAVVIIPVIGSLRQSYGGAVGGLTFGLAENPLITTLSTMGATLFPLVAVIELSDLGSPAIMGLSYVGGALGVLPDAILVGPLLAIVQDSQSSSPATWLMQELGMSYGPGFTPFAEAYLNFGWGGGVVAMAVYGIIFALLLRFPNSTAGGSALRIAIVIASFALIGFSVRGSSNFVFAYLVRYVAVPGIIVVLLARARTQARLRSARHE